MKEKHLVSNSQIHKGSGDNIINNKISKVDNWTLDLKNQKEPLIVSLSKIPHSSQFLGTNEMSDCSETIPFETLTQLAEHIDDASDRFTEVINYVQDVSSSLEENLGNVSVKWLIIHELIYAVGVSLVFSKRYVNLKKLFEMRTADNSSSILERAVKEEFSILRENRCTYFSEPVNDIMHQFIVSKSRQHRLPYIFQEFEFLQTLHLSFAGRGNLSLSPYSHEWSNFMGKVFFKNEDYFSNTLRAIKQNIPMEFLKVFPYFSYSEFRAQIDSLLSYLERVYPMCYRGPRCFEEVVKLV